MCSCDACSGGFVVVNKIAAIHKERLIASSAASAAYYQRAKEENIWRMKPIKVISKQTMKILPDENDKKLLAKSRKRRRKYRQLNR